MGGRAIAYLAQMLAENPNFGDIARNEESVERLTQILHELHSNRYRVFGDHLEMMIRDLIDELKWAVDRIKK